MKVLISSIGTRGEVQPILALALELRALGHAAALCVAPNFKPWVESFGDRVHADRAGRAEVRRNRRSRRLGQEADREQWRQIVSHSVREQFRDRARAARGRDLIVVAGGLQSAGRSVAEALNIPYVYAAYCAGTLPSHAHPPPTIRPQSLPGFLSRLQSLPGLVNRVLWTESERHWNDLFRDTVNEQRAALGLGPIVSVPRHIFTNRPWLAADAALGPAAPSASLTITQTGAWRLPSPAPLPDASRAIPRERRAAALPRLRQHARESGDEPRAHRGRARGRPARGDLARLG